MRSMGYAGQKLKMQFEKHIDLNLLYNLVTKKIIVLKHFKFKKYYIDLGTNITFYPSWDWGTKKSIITIIYKVYMQNEKNSNCVYY